VALARALDAAPWELTTVRPEEATFADLRCWAGLTQAQLAERAGLAPTTYAALERHELLLRPEVTRRIARALGKSTKTAEVEAAYRRSPGTRPSTSAPS
jgi:DNA-binding XRE family transcriptional regulator